MEHGDTGNSSGPAVHLESVALMPQGRYGLEAAWETLVRWHQEEHGGRIDFCTEQPCHACSRARYRVPGQYR